MKEQKITLLGWSHTNDSWDIYGYFETIKKAKDFIREKGFDMRYFKIDCENDNHEGLK